MAFILATFVASCTLPGCECYWSVSPKGTQLIMGKGRNKNGNCSQVQSVVCWEQRNIARVCMFCVFVDDYYRRHDKCTSTALLPACVDFCYNKLIFSVFQ